MRLRTCRPWESPRPIRVTLYGCIAGMLYLGLFPNGMVQVTAAAVNLLR